MKSLSSLGVQALAFTLLVLGLLSCKGKDNKTPEEPLHYTYVGKVTYKSEKKDISGDKVIVSVTYWKGKHWFSFNSKIPPIRDIKLDKNGKAVGLEPDSEGRKSEITLLGEILTFHYYKNGGTWIGDCRRFKNTAGKPNAE